MLGQLTGAAHGHLSVLAIILLVVTGIIALYVFIKIEHFLLRLAGGLIGLLLIAAGVWWFFLRR